MAFHRQTSFGIYPAVPKANVYVVKCFVSLMISANEEWIQFHLFSCDLMAAFWNKLSIPSSNVNAINMRDFDMPFFSTQSRCKKAEVVLFILEKLCFYYCLFGSKWIPPVCCCVLLVSQAKFLLIDFFWFENFWLLFFSHFFRTKKKDLKWNSIEKSPVSFTEHIFLWRYRNIEIIILNVTIHNIKVTIHNIKVYFLEEIISACQKIMLQNLSKKSNYFPLFSMYQLSLIAIRGK